MKVFQCSSGGMVPTIPTVFPSCYSLQTAASTQDSDYPGIFPLSASYPLDSSASHSLVQSSPAGDSPTTALAENNATIAAEPAVPAASEESPSMENESAPSPEAATEVTPEATSLQAAPSMPFEQAVPNSAFGSAAQFLLRDSQAQNAAALSLQPQVVSGNDIRFTGQQLTFAPNGLYFISLLLSAQVGTSGFGEIIPQIAGALRREYAAYASTSSQSGTAGLCSSFLLSTAGQQRPLSLELIFHTSALRGVPVQGSLTAFKVGTPVVLQ